MVHVFLGTTEWMGLVLVVFGSSDWDGAGTTDWDDAGIPDWDIGGITDWDSVGITDWDKCWYYWLG